MSKSVAIWTRELVLCAGKGDMKGVQKALSKGGDPLWNHSAALCQAAQDGFLDVVQYLIPFSEVNANGHQPLKIAMIHGHERCIDELLKHKLKGFDMDDIMETCIDWRSSVGVKKCIPFCDVAKKDFYFFRRSAEMNSIESVELLLPLSDASAHGSSALYHAAVNMNKRMIKLLYPLSDVEKVKKKLKVAGHESGLSMLSSVVDADSLCRKHGVSSSRKLSRSGL